jgi:hypothetical protein
MPYIGHAPTNAGSFILLDDLEGTGTGSFNGSTVTFNLKVGSVSVSPKASSLIVSLDGVIQQSPSSYTTSGSTIVFTEAPAANTEFYGMLMGQSSSVGAGTITLADMAANSVDSDQYVDLSIDNAHVATGLDAVKLADGTVTNAELQYINSLSSNAQTQISAKSPTASPTFTGTVVLPNVPAIVTTQLDLKSPLASPTFTGTPAAPTASATTNTTQLATTAFVRTEVTNLIDSAPSTLDTLNELAAALGDDANFSTTVTNSIATKLPLAGGAMTGAVTGMTGLTGGTGDFNWDSNTLVVDSSESRVGIGTASPSTDMHIYNSGNAFQRIQGGTGAYLQFEEDDGTADENYMVWLDGGKLNFKNQTDAFDGGNHCMTMDSAGNVGIGTTTPGSSHAKANKLVVGGGSACGIGLYAGVNEGWYAFSRDNANNTDAYDGGMSYDGSRNLKFHTNAGATRLTIDGSGNATFAGTVLIDGLSNYTGLEVKGAGGSRPQIKWTNVNNGVIGSIYGTEGNALIFSSGTGGATSLTLDSSQNATFAGKVNGVQRQVAVLEGDDNTRRAVNLGTIKTNRMIMIEAFSNSRLSNAGAEWGYLRAVVVFGSEPTNGGYQFEELEKNGSAFSYGVQTKGSDPNKTLQIYFDHGSSSSTSSGTEYIFQFKCETINGDHIAIAMNDPPP